MVSQWPEKAFNSARGQYTFWETLSRSKSRVHAWSIPTDPSPRALNRLWKDQQEMTEHDDVYFTGAPQLSLTKYFRDHFSRVSLTIFWLGNLDVAIAKNSRNCMFANL